MNRKGLDIIIILNQIVGIQLSKHHNHKHNTLLNLDTIETTTITIYLQG